MPEPFPEPRRPRPASSLRRWGRLASVVVLGFASGLPLGLTGQAMQAWLTVESVPLATIGFLGLIGLPYTFKFLWAPLLDRFELLAAWGRRRGWIVATQLALAATLLAIASVSPSRALPTFALLALTVAFLSATQDVVVDAYRTELLAADERGLGSSLHVLGYRLAMIVSGGLTLIWTDPVQGGGWTWPQVYRAMALPMLAVAAFSALALPRVAPAPRPTGDGRHDLAGFAAVAAAAAVGYALTVHVVTPALAALLGPWLASGTLAAPLRERWIDLAALVVGLALTLPLAAWAARRARYETLLGGLRGYFAQPGALAFLAFIVLYKLGDAFAGALLTPFLLKGVGYASAEVGVVNKVIGLWLTIAGALLGGALMLRLGLWRALLAFGVLQALSNAGFWWLAEGGRGALGAWRLPPFDWGVVALKAATEVDGALLAAVAFENVSGGMGTAAFVALLMSLTQQRFTATQFAMLSAFASVGRVWVAPLAGVWAESFGWSAFFAASIAASLPGLAMLPALRPAIERLAAPRGAAPADD